MAEDLADRQGNTQRRSPYVGLPGRQLPPLNASVRDCLGRLPGCWQVEAVAGLPLWLPRLGVTVLPHSAVTGGVLCTIAAADSQPARLPTGVFVVEDVEITTAVAADPCARMTFAVQARLSAEEFREVWLVRLAVVDPRYRSTAVVLDGLDRDTLTVTVSAAARRRSVFRTVRALSSRLDRLCRAGFLVPLDDPAVGVTAGLGDGARYGLRLPLPGWPQ